MGTTDTHVRAPYRGKGVSNRCANVNNGPSKTLTTDPCDRVRSTLSRQPFSPHRAHSLILVSDMRLANGDSVVLMGSGIIQLLA